MTKFKRMFAVSGASLAALVATFVVATPAHADGSECTEASGKYVYCAGSVNFTSNGELFDVYDNASDGAGQIVYWKIMGVSQTPMEYHGGVGWKRFDKSIAEGKELEYKVCIMDNGVVKTGTCSLYRVDYA